MGMMNALLLYSKKLVNGNVILLLFFNKKLAQLTD